MDVPFVPRKISSTRSLSPAFLNIYGKERYLNPSRANNQASTSRAPSSSATFLDWWKPDNETRPSLSDIIWPSAGAFATMAVLGKMDELLAPTGLSITIAPVGAACAVLFVTPNAPAARIYNIFVGEICCAIIAVLVFAMLGPGWLARSTSLAACIAFMICTCSVHPPAASLPIMFIDGPKLHQLSFWYALFPGAAGSVILFLIVPYLTETSDPSECIQSKQTSSISDHVFFKHMEPLYPYSGSSPPTEGSPKFLK